MQTSKAVVLLWNLALLSLMLFNLSQALPQCGNQITISGTFTCNGAGVPFSRMHFVQRIGFLRSVLGRGTTSEQGDFEISGAPIALPEGLPSTLALHASYDYYDPQNSDRRVLRVVYNDIEDVDMNGNGNIEVGVVEKKNHRCAAYQAFYAATRDYVKRVGEPLPTRILVRVDEPVRGAPFTKFTDVLSNKNVVWNMELAQHELAHVVRHYFDGDYEHFEEARKKHACQECQDHNCDSITSKAFAFNEGWAMYWASQCEGDQYDPTARLDIAGNVAAALRNLQSSCATSYKDMVVVLKNNPGSIYSYTEFETKHQLLYLCP